MGTDPATRLGAVLLFVSLWLFPLGELAPNRVLRGIDLDPAAVFGGWVFPIGLFILALATVQFLPAASHGQAGRVDALPVWRTAKAAAPWISAGLPTLLLVALASTPLPDATYDPAIARISLGSGSWLFCVGSLLVAGSGRTARRLRVVLALLLPIAAAAAGLLSRLGLVREFGVIRETFFSEFWRHLLLSFSSAALAILPGVFLGYLCWRRPRVREWILGIVNVFQVAPTLSLLGLLMIPLTFLAVSFPALAAMGIRGIGFAPAFIVLFLYCLLPITANSLAGFTQVDRDVLDSAVAMGMEERQILARIAFPLALPLIFSGIRTALTQNIGNTILAGLIGGGGMGALIFLGLSQSASDLVILGTLPVVALALAADSVLHRMENMVRARMGVSNDPMDGRI